MCLFIAWENRRLKNIKSNPKPKSIVTETEEVSEQTQEVPPETSVEQDAMNYYVSENIPDDLKEELNNLNLDEEQENVEEETNETVEADVLESVEADVLEGVEADVLEGVEAEAEAENNEPIEMVDVSEPGIIEEIIIDTKSEDDEILNLELELEKIKIIYVKI